MKLPLQVALLLFCLNSFGQKTKEIKLSKEKVVSAKTIYDLISDIPKDCKVNDFIFSANPSGSALKEFSCMGTRFSAEAKTVMINIEKGKWFFIENIRSSCPASHKKDYKIIVD